jgi:uncharacterized protein (DUF488 family)
MTPPLPGPLVLTIGHSTRPLDELVRLLRAHGVTVVVDVRTVPRSRRNQQFNRDTLPPVLASHGIRYVHLPELGGLRRPRANSVNTGWRNAGFRGFADHMQSTAFAEALTALLDLAARETVAVMCAEAVPWRCHRSLIADAVAVRGAVVEHIVTRARREPHRLTAWARVDGFRITYPAAQGHLGLDTPSAAPPPARRSRTSRPDLP